MKTFQKGKPARQGDLDFKETEKEATGKPVKELLLAEGEVTGHNHMLIADVGSEIIGDKTHFTIKGTAKLVHPEHDTIQYPAGNYIVLPEREFDYINEEISKVQD